jgi:hypothetical protein
MSATGLRPVPVFAQSIKIKFTAIALRAYYGSYEKGGEHSALLPYKET